MLSHEINDLDSKYEDVDGFGGDVEVDVGSFIISTGKDHGIGVGIGEGVDADVGPDVVVGEGVGTCVDHIVGEGVSYDTIMGGFVNICSDSKNDSKE